MAGWNSVIDSEEGLKGTEAVIDKDFAAQKLAELVDADTLVILTAVDHVYVNYNQPNQKLEHVTVNQLEEYIEEQQFAAGSMLPKLKLLLILLIQIQKEKQLLRL